MLRRLLAMAVALGAALLLTAAHLPTAAEGGEPAPLVEAADPIRDQYIVTLDEGITPDAALRTAAPGVEPLFTYTTVLNGFAAKLTADQLEALRAMPGVSAVEQDAHAVAEPIEPGRAAASWGLDRIDQRLLPLDGQFTTRSAGAGTTVYVIDTGIDYGHEEFDGRAVPGFDAVNDGRNGEDCNGHGTHVAGTAGGETYGVAPGTRLVSVRVLGCDGQGSWAGVIAGFDWVARNAQQPAVANASLGGAYNSSVNEAADNLAAAGVLPVVAAGNESKDACQVSPASARGALTIGASDRADRQTSFSNWGRCLELFAPGQDIVSARLGGGSVSLNGTSMASPHVAGVAALVKSYAPSASPGQIADWIIAEATPGVLTVGPTSPNRLLFTDGL
ncbi:S8 family peptidase [Streptomyces sp. 6N223]|uniref:S8 family peptidase n=1 Tax=Streptomyces sp. 6N223 TaxID=3457412 RepID=UPI003FD16204